MSGWLIVLHKSLAMFLVMVVGALAARRGIWKPEAGRTVSRLLIDIVYPCYVVVQLLRTVDRPTLAAEWYVPALGFLVILLGQLVGMAGAPWVRDRDRRRTFVFLVAITNWIYLPLPIAESLFGGAGVRAVLLMNVGAQAAIWTIGVATLNPGLTARESLRHVATNPGILATIAGLLLAIALPAAAPGVDRLPLVFRPVLDGADLLGSLTIPLSLLVIGAQLGARRLAELKPEPALWGVLALRLAVVPAAAFLVLRLLAAFRFHVPDATRLVFFLIAAMPPAISCTLFTERYGGDSLLSSKAVFVGTLAGLATVPLLFALIQYAGG